MFPIVCIALFMLLCQATYGMNTTCQLHRLRQHGYDGDTPLTWVEISYDSFYDVHDNVSLKCSLENYCSITWYHNGIAIDGSTNQSAIYRFGTGNQILVIDDVMAGHHGSYKCIGSNGTSTISHEFYLNVHGVETSELAIYDAQVTVVGSVYLGQQLTLYCYAYNYVDITWYHDGESITPNGGRVTLMDVEQVLIIEKFSLGDDGTYKCVASNGTHNASREGEVQHNYFCLDDEILLNSCTPSDKNITAALGSNLTVTCTYSVGVGGSLFRANWYRINGTGHGQLNDTRLYIAPSSDDSADEGTYYTITLQQTGESNPNCTNQIFWTVTLTVVNVTEGTYGYYVVYGYRGYAVEDRIIQLVPEVRQDVTPVVRSGPVGATVGLSLLLFLLGFATWRRYHLDIRLFFKETWESDMNTNGDNAEKDGFLYDVYIACCDADTGVAIHRFLPALKERGYSTCLRVTDFLPGEGTHDTIWRCMNASRSCLLLISDHQLCQENIGLVEVQAAVHNLSCKKKGIIPVLLQDVTESKIEVYPILRHLVRTNPKLLCRKRDLASPKRFRTAAVFKGIRLALPPPSEKRRIGVVIQGYIDDEFTLVDDDWSSSSSNSNSTDDLEMGRKPPDVVITTRTQYYNKGSL